MLKKLKKLAKNLLAVPWLRAIYEGLTTATLNLFASNRLLATLYSGIGLLSFNREQFAVLRGRRDYYQNLKKDRVTHVELRRNTHRLEKGMVMQPARPVFAKDYIGETIEFYERAVWQYTSDNQNLDVGELEWAHDVLGHYFTAIKPGDSRIDQARQRYQATKQYFTPRHPGTKVPYPRKASLNSSVSYDDLLELAKQRRSVRWFKQKKVPRNLIDKALLIGRQAPTACNRLPYEFRVFDDPKIVKTVSAIPFGTAGFAHQIPAIVVIVGKLSSYFNPRDRHAIYVDSSLAAMSFMLGLETLGLSSSSIHWPDFEPLELNMQKTLGLDLSDRVVMLIAVGYAHPDGGVAYSQKKSLDAMRSYNITNET